MLHSQRPIHLEPVGRKHELALPQWSQSLRDRYLQGGTWLVANLWQSVRPSSRYSRQNYESIQESCMMFLISMESKTVSKCTRARTPVRWLIVSRIMWWRFQPEPWFQNWKLPLEAQRLYKPPDDLRWGWFDVCTLL